MKTTRTYLFVGSCNRPTPYFCSSNGRGIATFAFDEATGRTEFLRAMEDIDNPTFVIVDAERRRLYATSEMMAWREGVVSSYDIAPTTGELSLINRQRTLGNCVAQISLDRTKRFLFTANYGLNAATEQPNQSVVVMPIRDDGGLNPAFASALHTGTTGPQTDRQERSHTHAVVASPDNRFLVASDLGLDQLVVYRFEERNGSIDRIHEVALPPGSGPRHFVFHPSGKVIYAVNELNSTVASLSFDVVSGLAAVLDVAPSEPTADSIDNRCSEIQTSSDARLLLIGNRGNDSLSVFRLGVGGALSFVTAFASGGKTPRHFSFDPSGRFLAVANQDSDLISMFEFKPESEEFLPTGFDISTGTPTNICFCRL